MQTNGCRFFFLKDLQPKGMYRQVSYYFWRCHILYVPDSNRCTVCENGINGKQNVSFSAEKRIKGHKGFAVPYDKAGVRIPDIQKKRIFLRINVLNPECKGGVIRKMNDYGLSLQIRCFHERNLETVYRIVSCLG